MDALEIQMALQIQQAEDAVYMKILQGQVNKYAPAEVTNYLGTDNPYTDYQIRCMLDKYLIQIMNSEENDILDGTTFVIDCLVYWLKTRYHSKYRPLNEPIKAVKELIEDDEYTLVMIKL